MDKKDLKKKGIPEFLYFAPLYFLMFGILLSEVANKTIYSIYFRVGIPAVIMVIYAFTYLYYIKKAREIVKE